MLAVPIFLPLEARIALNIVFDFLFLHCGQVSSSFGLNIFTVEYPSSLEMAIIDGVQHFCWVVKLCCCILFVFSEGGC